MKKFKTLSIIFTLLIGFFVLVGCNRNVNANGYVAIDINPSVEFITDKDDLVIQVNALNEEGEILIANEDFIGMDVAEAAEQVINLAIELGYLDTESTVDNPNAVMVTTLHYNSQIATKLRTRIYNRLDQYFLNNGIWAVILTDTDMDELVEEAEELGISSGKLRLIKSIQTVDPTFDTQEASNMSVKALVEIIRDKQPLAYKITSLETRKEEINALLETVLDQAEIDALQAELSDIESQLNDIEVLKEQLRQVRLERVETYRENVRRWREEKPVRFRIFKNKWQQFKDELTPEQKRRIIRYLYERYNEE